MTEALSPSAIRTLALQNVGLFTGAFANAPRAIRYKGQTYIRDAAQTVDQKLNYLAMASLSNPEAVGAIANTPPKSLDAFAIDPDPSDVNAAKQAVDVAGGKLAAARAKVKGIRRQLAQFDKLIAEAKARRENVKADVSTFLTLGISTASEAIRWDNEINHNTELRSQLESGTGQYEGKGLAQALAEVDGAQADFDAAKQALRTAQSTYNDALASARAEEEQARQDAAATDALRQQAIADAAARTEAASATAEAQLSDFESLDVRDVAISGSFGADDDDDVYGYGWGADMRALLTVDQDEMGALASVSPYSFDRYYGCKCSPEEREYGCSCGSAGARGFDDGAYGVDFGQIATIVGGILLAAPAVIQGTTKPPSVEETQNKNDPPPAWLTNILKATGIQSVIDAESKKAGEAAGAKSAANLTPYVIGGIVVLALVVYLALKK